MEIVVGRVSLRAGGSARGHNGVRSVCDSLRSQSFWRARIGISRPALQARIPEYVLGQFTPEQAEALHASVFPTLQRTLEEWVAARVAGAASPSEGCDVDLEPAGDGDAVGPGGRSTSPGSSSLGRRAMSAGRLALGERTRAAVAAVANAS